MQRKACIEFLGAKRLRVTTSFKQKEFDIKNFEQAPNAIDLITLKPCHPYNLATSPLSFYAELVDGNGTISEPYEFTISVRTGDGSFDEIATMTCKTGSKVFFVDLP